MAKVDEYMAWQHLNLRINGSMYFQTKYIRPLLTGEPVNQKRLLRFEQNLSETLDLMETTWLKENPYVAGKEITIADLLAVTELEQPGILNRVLILNFSRLYIVLHLSYEFVLGMAGYDVRDNRPIISAYMDLVKSKLNPHYDEVHSIVYKTKQKYQDNLKKSASKL